MAVIDVHTHMLNDEWLRRILEHGGKFTVKELGGQRALHDDGAPFMTLMDPMFDYAQRIKDMDAANVDIAIVSLTCPNVYWGGEEMSTSTAQMMNDDMAAQQKAYPDRIRFFASLPWQYADAAVAELERAVSIGAVGVFVSANVAGLSLTDESLAPIWAAIDKAGLPVLVHPGAPPGVAEMDMARFNMVASVGFMFDTSMAITRMLYAGFFETYKNLKIIASHAGAAIPYILGRLDFCHQNMPPCREIISNPPSSYIDQIYFDSVTFQQESLQLCLDVAGKANLMYGSDYPHNIGDMKGCLARVDALPADAREAVRSKNAERIFNL